MVEVSTILGVGGIVVAFGLFLSPLSTIQRIIKGKSTFDFSQLPFLTQLVESSHWALWSTTLSNREEVFITNVLGALFMFTYACIFMFYAQQQPVPQRKALNLQALLAFCLILIALSIFLLVEKSLARTLLVACAVFYNCLKYSSPLSVARLVISTKSVQFMPLPLTLACLLCSLLWGLYGVVLHDIWIIIPNMLGLVCSFAQVVLWLCYCNSDSHSDSHSDNKGSACQVVSQHETDEETSHPQPTYQLKQVESEEEVGTRTCTPALSDEETASNSSTAGVEIVEVMDIETAQVLGELNI